LANDTDPHGLTLSAVLVSGPSNGTLTLNSNGSFTYTPKTHWAGTDSFQYYATDGQQNSNTATVTLTVINTGTLSTTADSYSVLHDQVLNVAASSGVLANDSDSDSDSLTASISSQPSHGKVALNADGSFTYTPNKGYTGSDSFQYTASDGVTTSTPTTVSITVTDNAPTAANHTYGIPENTAENVTAASGLLVGASDADSDPLTVSAWTQPGHGSLQVNSNGSFTYTPNTGYTGTDSFQYTVSDGALTATATVTLSVHASDAAPTAGSANFSMLHDQTLTETAAQGVLAYASDSDGDPMTASLVSGASHGTVTLNSDGSFTYTPNAGYIGSDSFQYAASGLPLPS
jgi:VCBS repeat-containing protein